VSLVLCSDDLDLIDERFGAGKRQVKNPATFVVHPAEPTLPGKLKNKRCETCGEYAHPSPAGDSDQRRESGVVAAIADDSPSDDERD
jgi:hypothetical protein